MVSLRATPGTGRHLGCSCQRCRSTSRELQESARAGLRIVGGIPQSASGQWQSRKALRPDQVEARRSGDTRGVGARSDDPAARGGARAHCAGVGRRVGGRRHLYDGWRVATDGESVAESVRGGGRDGLAADRPRSGRPPQLDATEEARIVAKTLDEAPPDGGTHWSTRSMAKATGWDQATISRL